MIMLEDVGTVMRALGAYPSEEQLKDEYLPSLIDPKNAGFVSYRTLEARLLGLIASNECEPNTADVLMQAFRSIDTENTGIISADVLEEMLTTKGSPFRPRELESFLEATKDAEGNVHDAFTDPELRYRQRYVDLTVNTEFRDIFVKRAQIIKEMRRIFDDKGWLEVETPVLQPIHGGGTEIEMQHMIIMRAPAAQFFR